MKVFLSIVALAIIGSIEAGTILQPENDATYFTDKLASIQGAITDTINAAMDLKVKEEKLQNIVDASSYFFRTESVTEYAVSSNAYQNGWGAKSGDCASKVYPGWDSSAQNYCGGDWCSYQQHVPEDRNCYVLAQREAMFQDNRDLQQVCAKFDPDCKGCRSDSDCPLETPNCHLGKCFECITNDQCDAGLVCDTSHGTCGEY